MIPAIQIRGLGKQYRLGEVSTGSLGHDLNRWWHRARGREDPYLKVSAPGAPGGGRPRRGRRSAPEYAWALRDLDLDVEPGEVLGIVGRNGAGKSTLLKILSRITAPTTGEARIRGRVGSLLEIGTGFHPELTGRENLFLNGSILGMTRPEIRSRLDEIVAFSGCERHLDTPVKRYSSGMVVRLGFAVAAHLEPEILIVDEVLAVGDFEFQRKCVGKMQDVARHGRTVLFVSHHLATLRSLCRTALWLDGGRAVSGKGGADAVAGAYEASGRTESGVAEIAPGQHRTVSAFQIRRIETLGGDGRPTPVFRYGEPIRIRLLVSCSEALARVQTGLAIRSNGLVLTTWYSGEQGVAPSDSLQPFELLIPGGALLPGWFELDAGASRFPGNIGLDFLRAPITISVSETGADPGWAPPRRHAGAVRLPGEWSRPEGGP